MKTFSLFFPMNAIIFQKRFWLLLFFLGCGISFINAQGLKGYVWGGITSQPVAYANVSLYTLPDTALYTGCVTDTNGFFEFKSTGAQAYLSGAQAYLLKVTYVGYKDFTTELEKSAAFLEIRLEEENRQLENITVTASKPMFRLVDNGIQVNVSHSLLNKENSPIDIFRKIPGLTLNKGKLEAFGLGEPIIYINEKKVMDFSEVEKLTVKDILNIRFVSNPGAAYDASGKAVLLITVSRPQDGWKFQIDSDETAGKKFSAAHGVHWNYQQGKWNLYGTYKYENFRTVYDNQDRTGIQTDTLWQYDITEKVKEHIQTHTYQAGTTYKLGDTHTVNLQYDGFKTHSDTWRTSANAVAANGYSFDLLHIASGQKAKDWLHHVSGFYKGNWSTPLAFRLYADYVRKRSRQKQTVTETSAEAEESSSRIFTESFSDFDIYALNPSFMYTTGKHQFIFGGDLHYVAGANRLLVENTPFDGASSSHTEQKQAAYVTYAYGNDFLSLSAGLRYEHLFAEMKDKFDSTKDRTRHFNNFFPSINLRYSPGECSHAFAYSVKTTRPNYDVLNTNVYYTNRFNYTIGNPAIDPAIWHTLSYSFMYKFVYFNLLYANMKNYIGHTFYADAEHPTVIVTSYANYDRFQQLAAVFNLQYQLSFWQPAFMFYFLKPFFYVDYLGEKVKNNRPVVNILYNNSFELPWKITLNMEYQYTSRCNYLMFKLEPTHQINLGVQRAFLNDHLQVILKADDLFRGNSNNYTGKINTITFDHSEHPDSRKFSIHLIYRFNNYEKKVSQNAVTEELQRLP